MMEEFNNYFNQMYSQNLDDMAAIGLQFKVMEWGRKFMTMYYDARQSIYLHIFVTHAWRWRRLSIHSSEALEKINAFMKSQKRRFRDRRATDGQPKSAKGALCSMVRVVNAALTFGPYGSQTKRKRDLTCSNCQQKGHQKNNKICPKHPSQNSKKQKLIDDEQRYLNLVEEYC